MTDLGVLKSTIELGKELSNVLGSVKDKLWGDNDEAAAKLGEAIDELLKFYQAVNNEITGYQSLDFSDPKNLPANKKVLFDLDSGMLRARIEQARGHCEKIKLIYDTYLEKWFRKVLGDSADYQKVNAIFLELTVFDLNMFQATVELEEFIRQEAEQVLNYVGSKEYDKADEQVFSSREVIGPVRKSISQLLTSLFALKNQFVKQSGTV